MRLNFAKACPPQQTMFSSLHVILLFASLFLTKAYGQCTGTNGYISDSRQCDKYYQCKDGSTTEHFCPDGLVFNEYGNPQSIRCELPFNVDCQGREATQSPQPTPNCPRRYGMFRDPQSCAKFYYCVDGFPHTMNCPEGLAYNEYRGLCDWPEFVEGCPGEEMLGFHCPEPSKKEVDDFGDPRYPHPTDCKKLYVCVLSPYGDGYKRVPRLLGCEYGLVFNDEIKSCDNPENVRGCENYYGSKSRRLNSLVESFSKDYDYK